MLTAWLVIEIPWSPNIVTIGSFLLTWHGLFTAIGILAGVQLSLRMARVTGFGVDEAYNAALIGVPAGIVGARLLFVGEHWDFYGAHPWEILAINEGGISIWGAVLGGVAGGVAFARWRGYQIGRGLDTTAFGLILGMAIGRLGDLVNGEHLARASNLPWAVLYTNPESPAFAHSLVVGPHHPATTYELIGDLVILGVLFWALRRPFRDRPGLTFFVFFVGYAVMRFFLTYLRVDSDEALGLRIPQLVSIAVVVGSLPAIAYFARQSRTRDGSAGGAPPPPPAPPPGARVPVRRR
ncbi:MAG: prolipoprotein diacylglyceryl transferase [Dehalococcoidia bacterium]|nr:prolipoprotein diacylglyceryl transferase [Dehalococcoidia bacterium]